MTVRFGTGCGGHGCSACSTGQVGLASTSPRKVPCDGVPVLPGAAVLVLVGGGVLILLEEVMPALPGAQAARLMMIPPDITQPMRKKPKRLNTCCIRASIVSIRATKQRRTPLSTHSFL